MFRFTSIPKLLIPSTIVALGLAPSMSQAAPVTLRYDFRAVIASTWYNHWCYDDDSCALYEDAGDATTYQGPPVSTRGAGWLEVTLDDRYLEEYGNYEVAIEYSILGLPNYFWNPWAAWAGYDPVTKALSVTAYTYDDDFWIDLAPDDGYAGSGYVYWEQDRSGVDHARADFWLYDVTVTDLSAPQPAPVPLPAGLPLLSAGMLGLGWFWRRRRRA